MAIFPRLMSARLYAGQWKDTKSSSLERNELLRTIKRLGRTLWKKWSGYHRRSLVETALLHKDFITI
jgi:hypothetical protein